MKSQRNHSAVSLRFFRNVGVDAFLPPLLLTISATLLPAQFKFSEPVETANINGAAPIGESGVDVSVDGSTIYFSSPDYPSNEFPPGGFYLYSASRDSAADPWSHPEPLPIELNQGSDAAPSLSSDGLALYFARGEEIGPALDSDIYVATRTSLESPWSPPTLVEGVNLPGQYDSSPEISTNGLELYFTSVRSGGRGSYDLWVSRRSDLSSSWSEPENLSVLNSSNWDDTPDLSQDGLTLFFTSTKGGASPLVSTDFNLWMSRRDTLDSPWQPPVPLPDIINELPAFSPHLSPDGSTFYFARSSLVTTNLVRVGEDFDIWESAVTPELPGDFNFDDRLDAGDIDRLRGDLTAQMFDLTGDGAIDQADRDHWVTSLAKTYYGDADLNSEFNSSDFTQVFLAGEYEDAIEDNSGWAEGDWDGDGDFTSGDFVAAFLDGGYEQGPRPAAAVPEPSTCLLIVLAMLKLATTCRQTTAQLCG